MKAYLTEFIGTFFLVLTIFLTGVAGLAVAPLAIGATLMVMVYMGGHISGAHYNPAVSLACLIRGALKPKDFGPYLVAQVAGALCASLIGHYITGSGFAPRPGAEVGTGPALLVEILYTFALALVVLNVATSKKTEGNSFYGLAIGFTIAAAAFAGGGISGGAYNPAVGTGPIIIDAILTEGAGFSNLWLYIVGPFVGGAAAAFVFKFQEGNGGGGES